jgi:23S rRNA (cytidine2498-2'-O)-methyltransferase
LLFTERQISDLVVIAPRGFETVLEEELGGRTNEQFDRLFLVKGKQVPRFAQNVWLKPQTFQIKSINEAAKHLRGIQRNWWLHSTHHHRRAELIKAQLPPLKPKPIEVMSAVPTAPLGSWTLLDEKTVLYSAECSSPFPDGEVEFIENKTEPPSRAYLKLWELFTLIGKHPKAGDKVVDLGSAPGGWTWVLDQLGCDVTSVDKAPLETKTQFSSRVNYLSESAFGLKPTEDMQWMFSDVICYPERLLELVKKWEPLVPNLVCTIKFQGETNFKTVDEFLKIPGSEIRHLSCNKHELTWWRISSSK